MDIAFYGCLEVIQDQKFHIFTVYVTILDNSWGLFIFSNYIGEIDHFTWTFWKGPIFNAGPSEKFPFLDNPKEDHKEREFKP